MRLVDDLGGHAATQLGLDLDAADDGDVGSWLVASILLGGRTKEKEALSAFERLRAAGFAAPVELARAGAAAAHLELEAAGIQKPEVVAAVLFRVGSALADRWDGSVDALASGSDGLEELAGRLASLGSGFGRSAVLRFLVPLRDRWSVANDLPCTPAVAAAAAHLGVIADRDDAEGAPAAIARFLRNEMDDAVVPRSTPAARDAEAALDRLGRASCLRERRDRCPLGDRCPAS